MEAAGPSRSKRPRRPNFTDAEMLEMVTSIAVKQNIIFGKFHFDSASTAVRMKATAWQHVTDAVNAVSRVQREIADIKLKFKHFKSEVKKKRAKDLQYQRGTGGGPSEEVKYTPAEEEVLNLIPDAAIQVVPGIPDPDEVALAEGSSVAGAVPAGQSLHVHFEETDNPDSQMPLEVVDVSQSPSRDSPTFEEDWQQVLEMNLADHSYATATSYTQP
ncbi:hypothetical protein Pcinc_001740 [Petrolisthes cinctipes]|uniref:Regulatory protein zeste n=1 Tax=Petrolisthes cinctipes TaxID=88211 RepID=A0AAE1GMP6_PETCI|nr:hypothetical protein Pcinc_001740 [Petrolisthes cinctipes]